MRTPIDVIKWKVNPLALAMKLTKEEVVPYFKDGRRISFLLERVISRSSVPGKLAPSERDYFDIEDSKGNKWEVRCLTENGVNFGPSNGIGKDRKFNEQDFKKKLKLIKGYLLCDVTNFPTVYVYKITSKEVLEAFSSGKLGKSASTKSPARARLIFQICPT